MSTAIMSSAETVFAGPQPSPVKRWLREPLLHFLLAGLALFAVYRALNPAAVEQEKRSRIELTDGRPPPTGYDLDGAVENKNIPFTDVKRRFPYEYPSK